MPGSSFSLLAAAGERQNAQAHVRQAGSLAPGKRGWPICAGLALRGHIVSEYVHGLACVRSPPCLAGQNSPLGDPAVSLEVSLPSLRRALLSTCSPELCGGRMGPLPPHAKTGRCPSCLPLPLTLSVCSWTRSPMESGRAFKRFLSTFRTCR